MIIALLDGRTADSNELTFNPETYHVTWRGEDVTNNMRQSDKAAIWEDFDRSVDNERAYAEKYFREHGTTPPPTGSTSTFVNFWQQIVSDPLAAPLETLDATTAKLWDNSTVKTLVVIVGAIAVLYGLSLVVKLKPAA